MAKARSIKRTRSRKKSSSLSFLSDSVQGFIARRLVDASAGMLFVAGFIGLISLISYEHTDPSWNTASDAPGDIANWAGAPGAWASDVLLQTLGAAAFIPCAAFLLWGIRVFRRESISPAWARLVCLMIACVTISMAMAVIPSGGWIVHPYLGSTTGTLLLDSFARGLGALIGGDHHVSLAALFGIIGIAATIYAAAISREELAYAGAVIWTGVVSAAIFVANAATSFVGWVSHYNDDDYKPKKIKAPAMPKARKQPKMTADDADEEDDIEVDMEEEDEEEEEPKPSRLAAFKKAPAIPVVAPAKAETPKKKTDSQQRFALSGGDAEWELPPLSLLKEPPADAISAKPSADSLRRNAELLQNVLADFNIEGEIVSIHPGPVVTLYELEPAPGTKTSRVIGLADDIARSMSAVSVRCAVVPGRNVIGIELPNKTRETVYMRELLDSDLVEKTKAKLALVLGKDIGGQPIIADLAKMPHLLVAGTTGSGKSVAVNTMILSLLLRLSPAQCRLIMIDPKMLELSIYDDIPHLLCPVVTEPGKAVVALKWTVQEMEERYRAMSKLGVRNIEGYNTRLAEARKKGETIMRKVQTGFESDTGKPVYEEQPLDLTDLPYIVVIVDEFADLMLVAGKDVENAIQRLAQMARAAGIHIIMATQRPSVDVVTGVIKANFPTRISFQVTSKIDSRTILGESGAEQLLGMGDMLYMAPGGRVTRVHGPFVSDKEVENVVDVLKAQGEPAYIEEVTSGGDFDGSEVMNAMFGGGEGGGNGVDELYDQAVAIVAREGKASTSFIQRHLQIGYNRAARIIEEMERQGVISKANAVGKREILVHNFSDH